MIKRILKNAIKVPLQVLKRYKAKKGLSQLISNEYPVLRSIGCALHQSLDNIICVDEKKLIYLIEKRRYHLLSLDKQIPIIDYGAGSQHLNRRKEEMEIGIGSNMKISDICKASKSEFWSIFLFKMIRNLKPLSCLELGSCLGISASYQATALKINGIGNITTLEGSPEIARIAQETFQILKLENVSMVIGPFHKILKDVFESCKPIDFFFNDGHHDHYAVIKYFDESTNYLSDEAVIVFDDISWSPGMRRAWNRIEDDERVTASIDLNTMGIALVQKNSKSKYKFKISI